jgi:HEAT repeat protein
VTSGAFPLIVLSVVIAVLSALSLAFGVVALALRFANARKARRWGALERRWNTALLDVLSGDSTVDALQGLVGPRDHSYFLAFLLRLLRRLRGAERDTLIALAQPHLPAILWQLDSRIPEVRARAVQTLSLLGADAYRAAVLSALADRSPLVSMVAARALARGRDPQHAAAILHHLENFDEWSPRFLAAMLASMGPDAAAPLCDTLLDPSRPASVRAVAADALRALNDLHAADVAAAALGSATDRELVAACLRLLAALGRPEHLARIRPLLTSADPVARGAATRALASLGGAAERPQLRSALDDASPWVARAAAEGLLESGGVEVLRALAASDHPRAILAWQVLHGVAA